MENRNIQSFSDLTEEERKSIGMKTKVVTKVSDASIIDKLTGEILQQEHIESYCLDREPDYIKLYYSTFLLFNGAGDIPVDFIMAISNFITWAGKNSQMRFLSNAPVIDSICEMIGVKKAMYSRYLKRCVETGLLVPSPKYRGCYDVNPFFLARGRWEDIKSLRTTFDFKEGRWETIREFDGGTATPLPQPKEEI